MFEIVDGRTTTDRRTDGRTDDGRRIHGYPISSPCEPNGSGELKKAKINLSTLVLFTVIHLVVLIVYTKFEDCSTYRC